MNHKWHKKRNKRDRQYSILDNYRYVFTYLKQKAGGISFAVCGGNVVMNILQPFLESALAGAVAACLVSGKEPEVILLLLAGYVILLQAVRLLRSYLSELCDKILFLFRIDMMMEDFRKSVEMDCQCLESSQGQKKQAAADRALYFGNNSGINTFIKGLLLFFGNLGGLMIYGGIVGSRSLWLLLLLIGQAVLVSRFQKMAGRRYENLEKEINKEWTGFQYLRRESILPQNGKDIRLYGMDRWFLRVFHRQVDRIAALCDKERSGFAAAAIGEMVLSFLRNLLVYGYLILEMAQGRMELPAFLLYVGIVGGFESWMNGLFGAMEQIWQNKELIDRYRELMDFGIVDEEGKEAPVHPGKLHELRLENVCFRYEGNDQDTIHNLNLTIRPGERIALVGLNGAGKTTLIKLICGLYQPSSGRIYLDGQNLQSLAQKKVFQEFSVVFQDVFAFSFPLEENVSCCPGEQQSAEKLERCLKSAGLWQRVQALPEGSKTVMNKDLDEKGVSLSGGELQKLMLARALYKEAPVIILDEPTAALDPIAESEMYERYDELINDKTGIFISHRLSSTRFCDRILFLEEGTLTEEGSHEELMEKNGAYAELFRLQARNYRKTLQADFQ